MQSKSEKWQEPIPLTLVLESSMALAETVYKMVGRTWKRIRVGSGVVVEKLFNFGSVLYVCGSSGVSYRTPINVDTERL